MPGGADHRDHVRHDGRGRLDPARAGAFERDLADRVALQHDGVEGALDRGERMVAVDERRADAHVDAVADEAGATDQLHVHVERAGGSDVVERDVLDSLHLDPLERHPRAERDGGQDRRLGGRVETRDVLGRICLGVAEPLRLRERVVVGAALLHRREDEVRRAVDDPEHAVHVRDDERLAQHLDHGDRGADGGLEAELDTARGRRLEQLGAAAGDELLVRRHDRPAGAEELEHVASGRVDAAHHLGDDLDRRIVEDRREVVGEHVRLGRERPLLAGVAHERAGDAEPMPGRALDLVGRLLEQPVDGGADGAVSEQRYGNVDRRHAVSTSPRPGASIRAAPRRPSRAGTARPRRASPPAAPRRCPCPRPTRGRTRRTGCR